MFGYLYVREHPSYDYTCKVGITDNIPDRDSTYATGELHRGTFSSVFKINLDSVDPPRVLKEREKDPRLKTVETKIKDTFQMFHIYYDGGTEFFDRQVIVELESFLQSIGLDYTRLTEEEIKALTRCNRIKYSSRRRFTRERDTSVSDTSDKDSDRTGGKEPHPYQYDIISNSIEHFQTNDKGTLQLICGVGKTLISLWITQGLECKTFVIGVPNKLLLEQWKKAIHEVFGSIPCLIVSGGKSVQEICEFLNRGLDCVVLTTYASAHKVEKATKRISFEFDMKINDEVHHLSAKTFEANKKEYVKMLHIQSKRQLSLSATLKEVEGKDAVSNTDIQHFGTIMETKCLLWAIQKNILCDYQIQTTILNEEHQAGLFAHFQVTQENDKRLFLSAYNSLKSIADGNSHHVLIYSNSQEHSSQTIQYIKLLIENKYFNIVGLDYSDYHSSMKKKAQDKILSGFDNAPFGIISCVYCLGEGWDFPKLDATVFAENMTSDIRIVQSALRASRKNSMESNKVSKIILPILNQHDWSDRNPDFKKVREVIHHMGQEDISILQKVKVYRIDGNPQPRPDYSTVKTIEFGEYDEEFTKHLRLKTVERSSLGLTYAKAKTLVASKCLKSKQEYSVSCGQDIRLPLDPETTFHGQFTDWVDYLSFKGDYYDLETCKRKVTEYMNQYPDLKPLQFSEVMERLKQMDSSFPPPDLWEDYYQEDINKIIIISKKKKRVGCV